MYNKTEVHREIKKFPFICNLHDCPNQKQALLFTVRMNSRPSSHLTTLPFIEAFQTCRSGIWAATVWNTLQNPKGRGGLGSWRASTPVESVRLPYSRLAAVPCASSHGRQPRSDAFSTLTNARVSVQLSLVTRWPCTNTKSTQTIQLNIGFCLFVGFFSEVKATIRTLSTP